MAYINFKKLYSTGRNTSIKQTSSLNKHCICHNCDKKLDNKNVMVKHLKTCIVDRTCSWCNITFKNRGNLSRHAFYIHGDKSEISCEEGESIEKQNEFQEDHVIMRPPSTTLILKSAIKPTSLQNTCKVCNQTFKDTSRLLYHIRSLHFNLKAKIVSYDDKEINQVWFEKVYNSSKIVEMKKAAHNLLLIRKLEDDTKVTIQECDTVTDLSDMYPTQSKSTIEKCYICQQTYLKRDLKKHCDDRHAQIKKHHCNNCNKSFKRTFTFVRHVCHKQRGRRRRLIV